ncbi:hypothetical protein NPIL_178591 [Nephila pilipes]|uniref:Uncharacterized protein n=1 Tax=Nephila pilipes TaxID=299642 RepID=A0A8X6TCS4_NEPPI|nr:hypothetical protein NPIL_178591 [Nephila pilipes]
MRQGISMFEHCIKWHCVRTIESSASFHCKRLKPRNSPSPAIEIIKRNVGLHEVSRANIFENKRQRLNSSPQPGPSGYQASAAEERRNNTRSRTCLNTFQTYTILTDSNFIQNLHGFLQNSKEEVIRIVENKSKEKKGIKWYICVKVRFVRKTAETEEEKCKISSKFHPLPLPSNSSHDDNIFKKASVTFFSGDSFTRVISQIDRK